MEIINKESAKDKETTNSKGYFYICFGLFLIGYVTYCILNSDSECIKYFGRTGLVTNCENRSAGYINLSFFGCLGILFVTVGIVDFLKKMNKPQS
ncbi:hypothetical protein [Bdellovibrio bacteriovorus]|uniref:hypothetical protein n=1 Tax=Bdellovibrio bacteriovorus TaxID=959 RepID=UPI0035A59F8C